MIQKTDCIVAIQNMINTNYPLDKGQLGFDGMIENYSGYINSKHEDVIVNNCKFQYGYSYFLSFDKKALWIVFRGSANNQDWKFNFEFAQRAATFDDEPYGYKTESGVAVHSGFLTDYMQVREIIHKIVKDAINIAYVHNIMVCGHSLGGALAQICAVDIEYNFGKLVSTQSITAGAPRAFNKAGSDSYNKRVPDTIRIVNENDPVTRVPFESMGYEHVGKEVRIGMQWWSYIALWNWMPIINMLALWDHCPSLYYRHMREFSNTEYSRITNGR